MKPFDAAGLFQMTPSSSGLRRRAIRGAGVTVVAQGLVFASQLLSTVVLARVLMPSDFGLVAMVTTFSLLLTSFGPNGYSEAVMQSERMTHKLASTLFWITCGVGFLLTVAFAAAGSLLAKFYGDPRVTTVALSVSVCIFLTNSAVIHTALLKRALRFSVTSAIDIVATVVSVAGSILFALAGWGYWSLVFALIIRSAVQCLGAWGACRWLPGLPTRTPETVPMVKYALNVFGRFSFNYTTRNTDNLLVGWRFGPASLGFYKKAYDLFLLPANQLLIPVSDVVLSTLSRLERGSNEYKRYFLNGLSILAFVGLAGGGLLTLEGRDLIRVLLGAKWGEAGYIFTFFGPGIGIMLIYATSGLIHLSIGRADRWFRWVILEFVVTVILFVLGLRWGAVGVASAWSASFWILFVPAFHYAGKPIQFGVRPILATVWRYIAASALAGVVSRVLVHEIPFLSTATGAGGALIRIASASIVFCALYLAAVVALHGGPEPIRRMIRLLPDMLPARWSRGEKQGSKDAVLDSVEENNKTCSIGTESVH